MSFSASPHLTHHPRGNSAINDAATKNKMLASTMQFSNNNPHPIHQPTRPASQDTETRNNNPNPHRSGCLLFQDPTVCQHQLAATNTTHSNHTLTGMTYSSTAGTTTGTIH